MLIKKKIGNLSSFNVGNRLIDYIPVEWHECRKRILHKKTGSGKDIVLKFLTEPQNLQQDDVLYADEKRVVVVEILPCEVMVIAPENMLQMALVCYEIGNKHLPLFYEDDALLIPFDQPTFRLLEASGFNPSFQRRKLMNQLQTTVAPHAHFRSSDTLFSRIMKLSATNE
jgi:urease accessory protein